MIVKNNVVWMGILLVFIIIGCLATPVLSEGFDIPPGAAPDSSSDGTTDGSGSTVAAAAAAGAGSSAPAGGGNIPTSLAAKLSESPDASGGGVESFQNSAYTQKKKESFATMGGGSGVFSPQFEEAKHTGANAASWTSHSYQGPTGELVGPDELVFFAKTNSSPECCVYSKFSDSGGCKCLSSQQWQTISDRAGNNATSSEY